MTDQYGDEAEVMGVGESSSEGITNEEDLDEYEECTKYHLEQVFQELDYTKRKTMIGCTLGPRTS